MSGGDPAAFFLAVKHGFDMEMIRPHVPGYLWFVFLWKGIYSLTGINIFSILILSNIFWISLAIIGTYFLAKHLFTSTIEIYASFLVATNPVLLYYASTGKIYPFDTAFSVLFVYLFLRIRPRFLPLAMFAFGVSGGFRLSSVIAFFPVILSIYYLRRDEIQKLHSLLQSALAFIAGTLIWLLTMSALQGGVSNTVVILSALNSSPFTIFNYASAYATFLFWMVNAQASLLLLRMKNIISDLRSGKRNMWIIFSWIFFPSAFFIVKHYAKGYILIILPAFALLVAFCLTTIVNTNKRRMMFALIMAVNLGIFFFLPYRPMPLLSGSEREHRNIPGQFETFFGRMFSVYAPSYQHLRVDEQAASSIVEYVRKNTQSGASVLFDPAATEFVRPRGIETAIDDRSYLMMYLSEKDHFILNWQGKIRQNFTDTELLALPQLTLITDSRLVQMYATALSSAPAFTGEYISIFTLHNDKIPVLWEQMKKYFYQ